ncbi:MAG: SHOCT domain-containing protein [Clostridia bacterium]|nr:SHOCT domain-containing protein [Clostridia bacterium]
MFVPFYSVYWYYITAKRIEKLISSEENVSADFSTIILILGIFVSIAVPILLQSKLNTLSPLPANAYSHSSHAAHVNSSSMVNSEKKAIEEIRAYKELLDLGAISQEEFDEKKKEIFSKKGR